MPTQTINNRTQLNSTPKIKTASKLQMQNLYFISNTHDAKNFKQKTCAYTSTNVSYARIWRRRYNQHVEVLNTMIFFSKKWSRPLYSTSAHRSTKWKPNMIFQLSRVLDADVFEECHMYTSVQSQQFQQQTQADRCRKMCSYITLFIWRRDFAENETKVDQNLQAGKPHITTALESRTCLSMYILKTAYKRRRTHQKTDMC